MDIAQLINELTSDRTIKINEVPDIELYMDQVVGFIDSRMAHLKRHEKDKIITSTMVNNYAKAGIIKASHKKKYEQSHVLQLMMIYHLKQIISIQDIDHLLNSVVSREQVTIEQLYELFSQVREKNKKWLTDNVERQMGEIEPLVNNLPAKDQEGSRARLLALVLVLQAELLKRTAERLLDFDYLK
ncbi:MAG: DUF1836 domain-containing protein [Methylocystaceae bacterium]